MILSLHNNVPNLKVKASLHNAQCLLTGLSGVTIVFGKQPAKITSTQSAGHSGHSEPKRWGHN